LRSFKWDAGLQARINSTNVQELMREIRRASAVRDHWNDMTHILTADLLKPVYGFFGKIGWQPRWTDVTIEHMTSFEGVLKDIAKRNPTQEAQREVQRARFTYGGGASQIFIDKLTDAHIKRRDKVSLNDVISGRATVL
jgi:hypothetical protein